MRVCFNNMRNDPFFLVQMKRNNPDFYETMCKAIPEKMNKLKDEVEKLYAEDEQERKEIDKIIKERKKLQHDEKENVRS